MIDIFHVIIDTHWHWRKQQYHLESAFQNTVGYCRVPLPFSAYQQCTLRLTVQPLPLNIRRCYSKNISDSVGQLGLFDHNITCGPSGLHSFNKTSKWWLLLPDHLRPCITPKYALFLWLRYSDPDLHRQNTLDGISIWSQTFSHVLNRGCKDSI